MIDRPDWVDASLYPFRDRWIDHDGSTVHAIDEGNGTTLLMLHSNPTWSFMFRHVVRALRDEFRCVAVDYPGFGLSRAAPGYRYTLREHSDAVTAVIRALDLRDVVLVAHDWGGPIGLAALGRDPDRFSGVALGNTAPWPQDTFAARAFARVLGGRFGRWMIANHNAYLRWMMPSALRGHPLTDAEWAHYRAPFPTPASREPIWVSPRQIIDGRDFLSEVEAVLPSLQHLPALLMWAEKDPATKPSQLARLECTFPDHVTHMLAGVGHYLFEQSPDAIAEAIRSWRGGRASLG